MRYTDRHATADEGRFERPHRVFAPTTQRPPAEFRVTAIAPIPGAVPA